MATHTPSRDSMEASSERSPLLSSRTSPEGYNAVENGDASRQSSYLSADSGKKAKRRWPSVVALASLSVLFILALVVGFVAPATIESYARQSASFTPSHVSVSNYSASGVSIRIQGTAVLDAAKVKHGPTRNIGRFITWVTRKVATSPANVDVILPAYDNAVIGVATIPGMVIDIRNGHENAVDFLTEVRPADPDGIRRIAKDWFDGRLKKVEVRGDARVGIRSGLIRLGPQLISEVMTFTVSDIPEIPKYNLTDVNFHKPTNTSTDMLVDAHVSVDNEYPIDAVIPPVGVDILVPNCLASDPFIFLASVRSEAFAVKPYEKLQITAHGVVHQLKEDLTKICPRSHSSPLDLFLRNYVQGEKTKVFVRGARDSPPGTPTWLRDLMQSVTIPVPLPNRTMNNLIRNFSLTDVHLSLPDLDADPADPKSKLRISAAVKVLVGIPKELKFPVDVARVRADADVFYGEKKLGELNLRKWQKANSSLVDVDEDSITGLMIESSVDDAPLHVTDEDLFTKVIQKIVFQGVSVDLGIQAKVDVEVDLGFGKPIVRDIPAKGKITIKPISRGFGDVAPKINSLEVLDTSPTMIKLRASTNVTNPTPYSASIPYLDVHVFKNGSALASMTIQGAEIVPGLNSGLIVEATWNPMMMSGVEGAEIGRKLLSQFVSGINSTITIRTHAQSFPSLPNLGQALSKLSAQIPLPRLSLPKAPSGGDEEPPHFVNDATLHLLSSTSTFLLLSPFSKITLYVTSINATAFYNHTEPVGVIVYDIPFAVPPGDTLTPHLPVDWNIGDVGFEAVKKALGGSLKLDASAWIGVRIDKFKEMLWYVGHGIGAKVRA